jgi:hypothetical protein
MARDCVELRSRGFAFMWDLFPQDMKSLTPIDRYLCSNTCNGRPRAAAPLYFYEAQSDETSLTSHFPGLSLLLIRWGCFSQADLTRI